MGSGWNMGIDAKHMTIAKKIKKKNKQIMEDKNETNTIKNRPSWVSPQQGNEHEIETTLDECVFFFFEWELYGS